jgi:hypothetical protein
VVPGISVTSPQNSMRSSCISLEVAARSTAQANIAWPCIEHVRWLTELARYWLSSRSTRPLIDSSLIRLHYPENSVQVSFESVIDLIICKGFVRGNTPSFDKKAHFLSNGGE